MTIKRTLGTASILFALGVAALPAAAAEAGKDRRTPEEWAREGLGRVLDKLERFGRQIPLYGLPEMRENGDIVIPRWRRGPEADQPPAGKDGKLPDLEEIEA